MLKYLFEAHFADGTSVLQTREDKSVANNERSAFYDVTQRLDDVEVFGLYDENHVYVVDLRDGHFEIDGTPFFAVEDSLRLPSNVKYRLIYFRRHNVAINSSMEELSHTVRFHFGWEVTIDGNKYERVISVD